ncbi:uncharacterized protein BP5553_02942 [Venustampulla echinocandica]|uniref:RBR-type E3 ubiquitin transferase n=1 Tax=Venustampulla echinocandica TaxID=2656787 RepID=A0A370TSU4_9HELO|nr:uncharacterized protein BP5553_02942 [Venustampulla echinocandica]RDL38602.1 hypothetical protein BP5553_02942 [Venustampulla echinocandica]
MAMVAIMPGNWPKDGPEEEDMSDEPFLPRFSSSMMTAKPSPPAHDELFIDTNQSNEASSPSYLLFEPVVSSVSETEPIDNWRRYDPPRELLDFQDGTSTDIRSLLEPSIERIRDRHRADVEMRTAAARREKPLGRAGRASAKPRRDISMSGALDPSIFTHSPRSSQGSGASLSSGDSGYGSRSPAANSPDHASSRVEKKFLSAISSRFKLKRTDKTPNHPATPNQNGSALVLPTMQEPPGQVDVGNDAIPVPLTGECVSCLDDFATTNLIKLTCHSYCADCFQRLINNALESETHWPVKCCLTKIPSSTIEPHLDRKTQKKYHGREAEWSIPVGNRIYCAHPNCGTWISPEGIKRESNRAKCPKCSRKTCTSCRGISHTGTECPHDPALIATINLADQEGWKRCYSCHALVEHTQGCRHMTCRCNAQFCYICGLRWRTCSCTNDQLADIQGQAAIRRNEEAARTALQTAAAEEERRALWLVAEFERREAEMEAAEAEARRVQEEEEQRRQEEERIAAVNVRFLHLSTELESLHDVQHVRIAERYDLEQETLQKERENALETLSIRHPQETQVLALESQTKISDMEHKLEMEYHGLLAEEQRIEHKYVDELRAYWKGKPGGEYKVRAARDELRRDQDIEYKSWENYRKSKLQALAEGERKQMDTLRAKQRSEVRTVEGRAQIDEVEWKRKRAAEAKWVEVVINERTEILQGLERDEYAQGG